MSDDETPLPGAYLHKSHRVMWHDDLAAYKPMRARDLRERIIDIRGRSPDLARHFVQDGDRYGVTRRGVKIACKTWPPEKLASLDKVFSDARVATTRTRARASTRPQAGTWLTYNNTPIRDRAEMLNLTDMWRAQGEPANKDPTQWRRLAQAKDFVDFLAQTMGISHSLLFEAGEGRNGETLAHWQIALAYAKYLSPAFHMACNELVRNHMEGQLSPPAVPKQLEGMVAKLVQVTDDQGKQIAAQGKQVSDLIVLVTSLAERMSSDQQPRDFRPTDFGFDPPPQPVTTKKRGQSSLRPFVCEAKRWLKIRMPIQQMMAFAEELLVANKFAERGPPPNAFTKGNLLASPDGYNAGYVVNYQATRASDGSIFPMALNLTEAGCEWLRDLFREEFPSSSGDPEKDGRQSDFFRMPSIVQLDGSAWRTRRDRTT